MFPSTPDEKTMLERYAAARDTYAGFGVDTEAALERLARTPLSLHCWQGDDVTGFEPRAGAVDSGGIMATGGHPGRPRTPDELRQDMAKALDLIPGAMKVNLHAIYAETGGKSVERNALGPEHFQRWMDWAVERGCGLDFNPTFFAHPLAASGATLSSADESVRRYWVEHGAASRRIAAGMARAAGQPAVCNVWIPDGAKDRPMDRWGPRRRLAESLDEVFSEEFPPEEVVDAVEGKVFGIGSEDYVVGSHDFYLAYCALRGKALCLDTGHFHPTESAADKVSAVLAFLGEALVHVSRGLRWDSDHVVTLSDDTRDLFHEIVRGGALDRVRLALDFFDASINRVAAWAIGARCAKAALLNALVEPTALLREAEESGDGGTKLALLQDVKLLPLGAVWDAFCLRHGAPPATAWIGEAREYERRVLSER